MQSEILMPALPSPADSGRLAKWHVAEGQRVSAGDVVAEIVTGTMTMEIETERGGRVERLLVPVGSGPLSPSTPLAVIWVEGEERGGGSGHGLAADAGVAAGTSVSFPVPAKASEQLYREALRDGIAEEMRRNPRVIVLGPDVAQNRGAPKVCQGLLDEFGPARVLTTPPLEDVIVGVAIGAALQGLRPIVEFTSWASALKSIDLLQAEAASPHYLSGGAVSVGVVFRAPNGTLPGVAGSASRCVGALLAQIPGLKVAAPATTADAKGLLKSAVRDGGPVALLEHERLYAVSGPVSSSTELLVELGRARVARPGSALSIVAFGHATLSALAAAELLSAEGIDAEVIDLRSLRPLDLDTVLASVAKTGRLLTVEDGWPQGSIGAEITAEVAARAFDSLAAPPARLAGADVPMPYAAELAALAVPSADQVAEAARRLLRGR